MSHKHKDTSHHRKISKSREWMKTHKNAPEGNSTRSARPKLEFVLKCDSAGSVEAVNAAILKMSAAEVEIEIIHSGVGDINESDILMAETGSGLIVGFQVGILQGMEKELKSHSVEARLYDVIYKLTADIKDIAGSIVRHVPQEEILGNARVIALFKSSRKGIIIGCEVTEGYLAPGKHFRIISAMGPVYSGIIESMHIEKDAVQKAVPGQKAGIKIRDFNKVKIGDIVESFRPLSLKRVQGWQPGGGLVRVS